MTDVIFETSGSYDIKPKGTDGQDKNIIPNVSVTTPSLGTSSTRWNKAYVRDVDANGVIEATGDISSDADIVADGKIEANKDMDADGIALIVYGDSSSSDAQVLIGATTTGHRVFIACAAMSSTGTDARTIMAQENDEAAIPVISLKQRDESEAFIDLEGAYDSTAAKSITTGNGNGSVVGPKTKNTADYGFEYAGMFMVRTDIGNGLEDLWTPLYRKVTS